MNPVFFEDTDGYFFIEPQTKTASGWFHGRGPVRRNNPDSVSNFNISTARLLKSKEIPQGRVPVKWLKALLQGEK